MTNRREQLAQSFRDQARWGERLGSPFTVGALSLMIIAAFYHGSLSFQVVIEDYAPNKVAKVTLLLLVQFAAFALATAGILALLDIAFVG